jgi:hypothetical protein
MNIDFNAAFEGGMTKKDIEEMLARQLDMAENEYNAKKAAEALKEREARAQAHKAANKEQLKAEGRAHLINALIAYSEAFDLLEDGESWDEEDVTKVEQALIKLEDMIPMYIKLAQMQGEMDNLFREGDLGLGGPFFGGSL